MQVIASSHLPCATVTLCGYFPVKVTGLTSLSPGPYADTDSEQRAVNSCCGSMIVLWPEGTVKHRVMNPVSSKTAALKLHVCYKGPKYI